MLFRSLGLYPVEPLVVMKLLEDSQTARLRSRFGASESSDAEDEQRARVVREGLDAALPGQGAN